MLVLPQIRQRNVATLPCQSLSAAIRLALSTAMNTLQLERVKKVDISAEASCSSESHSPLYCCYTNRTAQFQIIRVATITQGLLERVVMPQARIYFEATLHDSLEVHTGNPITSILTDRIPCRQLAYTEEKPL